MNDVVLSSGVVLALLAIAATGVFSVQYAVEYLRSLFPDSWFGSFRKGGKGEKTRLWALLVSFGYALLAYTLHGLDNPALLEYPPAVRVAALTVILAVLAGGRADSKREPDYDLEFDDDLARFGHLELRDRP